MSDPALSATQLSQDESTLVSRLRAGDREAIAAIEKRFGHELRLFCRRMLADAGAAEDVVQDVLATCCQLSAESLPQTSIRGWLYQIARRRCIDVHRRRHGEARPDARGPRKAQPSFDNAVDPLTTPAGKALKLDRAAKVLALLDQMDEEMRSVIVMRYFQDLPREEIAEAIGLSLAGTKARLSKAMLLLREMLDAADHSGGR